MFHRQLLLTHAPSRRVVAALSNGNLALLVDLVRHGDLIDRVKDLHVAEEPTLYKTRPASRSSATRHGLRQTSPAIAFVRGASRAA
jgi:hypothetical protein